MDKFVIIDGNNLMFRAFYALPPMTNFNGENCNALFGFTNMLIRIIKDINPKYIAVTFDVSKKNFRHEMFEEYKGTRKPTPPELKSQFPLIKELLDKMNIRVVEREGLEADDLIGCLSKSFDTENIIVSADRDAFQLITEKTSIMFPKKGISETIILTKNNLKEHYGVDPDKVIELKSLMGDASDNIPGVAGVGEKTAITLLDKYKSLDGIYNNIDEITGKLKEKLIASRDNAYLSKMLATIVTDVDLEYSIEDFKYDFPFDNSVYEAFKYYQFNSILKKEELYNLSTKVETVNVDCKEIIDEIELNRIINELNNQKEIYIFFDSDAVHIYSDIEYKILFVKDLLSSGLVPELVFEKMKGILENEKIEKVLFDIKGTKHLLNKFGIDIKNATFDCLIARYLINSVAKANVDLSDVMAEMGITSDCLAYAISVIKKEYYAKMQSMAVLDVFNNIEMPLIDVLFDMEKQGFKVDKSKLKDLEIKYGQEITQLESQIYDIVGHKFNLSSPKQLGEVLFDELGLNIPSNKKKSTSIEILNEIIDKHEIVSLIIRYRAITKLYSTYIMGFEPLLDKDDKIHTVFNQTLTTTGRLSSSEPNLQNIPVRTEEGRTIRQVFIPSNDEGLIVSADYSQIELRLLANFSGDEKLINAFNSGEDIHSRTASEIFGVDIDKVDADLRRSAKAINFGIVYGISDFGLSQNIGISRKEASNYIKLYFERYPNIEKYIQGNVDYCKQNGFVKTYFGRIRPIQEIHSSNYNLRLFGERAAMNSPLQGTASDIIKLAMIKVYNTLKSKNLKSKIILQVHDELVLDVVKEELTQVKEILKDCMENVVNLAVRLTVNIEEGKTWYDAK